MKHRDAILSRIRHIMCMNHEYWLHDNLRLSHHLLIVQSPQVVMRDTLDPPSVSVLGLLHHPQLLQVPLIHPRRRGFPLPDHGLLEPESGDGDTHGLTCASCHQRGLGDVVQVPELTCDLGDVSYFERVPFPAATPCQSNTTG